MKDDTAVNVGDWHVRYGERHRMRRIQGFPEGIRGPRKVRLYERRTHYVLQWWDKEEKQTLSERVEGDLLSALSRARQIDERLELFRSSGTGRGRCGLDELVSRYREHLQKRADAGEVDSATFERYGSAIRHFGAFVERPSVSKKYRNVSAVNAGVPEFYRRYLMGQSFGKAPIVTYTHVTEDKVREHFLSALRTELAPVADAIERRFTELTR